MFICASCEINEVEENYKVCNPCHVAGASKVIEAWEMKMNQVYVTYQSRSRYFIELVKLDTGKNEAHVKSYFPNYAEWRIVKIPYEYKLKELSKEEQTKALETISKSTKDTREQFAKIRSKGPKEPGKGRSRGVLSGLGMLETWGKCFREFAHTEKAREKIKEAMLKEFPDKADSVNKWLDAYRGYYNKGRLPNTAKPEKEITSAEWMEKSSDVQA